MAFKDHSKRRDPDESDTAPALKPKRNRLAMRTRRDVTQAARETLRTVRRPKEVEQERDEPLISSHRTGRADQSHRDAIDYYSSGASPRHSTSKKTYQPPCPVIVMPLGHDTEDGHRSSLHKARPQNRAKSSHVLSQSRPRADVRSNHVNTNYCTDPPVKEEAWTEEEILATRSADIDNTVDSGFADFIRADSEWDESQKHEDVQDSRTESTDLSDLEDGLENGENYKSMSTEMTDATEGTDDSFILLSHQRCAVLTVVVLTVQLTILLIQLCLCGMAPLEVNPVIGPYPDAFSEWGAKNAYLMIEERQYFRLITPAFLHVGLLHFVLNALCTLRSAAIFEQEWGSFGWLTAYLLSTIGAVASSSVIDPNSIGVASSGALMGLFGAKVAQFIAYSCFELHSELYLDAARSHVSAVLCNMIIVFLLCFVTYIDISGHAGGFLAGLFTGMFLFCSAIKSIGLRFLWSLTGFLGLVSGGAGLAYYLLVETQADEELGDACQYFRNLYVEGYDCECKWS